VRAKFLFGSLRVIGSPKLHQVTEVFWLGGASGAGKSAVAAQLAKSYNLLVYSLDDVMGEHAQRSTAAESPFLTAFIGMDHDERWLTRTPSEMLDTFHWYRGEGFDLIRADLDAYPSHARVVVEGFRALPHLVAPLLPDNHHAMWLLPTPSFRRTAFELRDGLWTIAGKTSDPPRALENLLARDALFTERLRAELSALDLPYLEIDGSSSLDATVAAVADHFRLSSPA
jgi:hypothetical protein